MDAVTKLAGAVLISGVFIATAIYLGLTYETRVAVNSCIDAGKATASTASWDAEYLRANCGKIMLQRR